MGWIHPRNILKKVCIYIMILMLALAGCVQKPQEGSPVIALTSLTTAEKGLLKAAGCVKSLVFDLTLPDGRLNMVDLWMDCYEKGQYKGTIINMSAPVSRDGEHNHRILFTIGESDAKINTEKWSVSLISGENAVTKSAMAAFRPGVVTSTMQGNDRVDILEGKSITLAVIAESEAVDAEAGKTAFTGVPREFFKNESATLGELFQNDYVYILLCKFTDRKGE